MSGRHFLELGTVLIAPFICIFTALRKSAFITGLYGGCNLPPDYYSLLFSPYLWYWYCRKQCFCVRVQRVFKQLRGRGLFYKLAKIHHSNIIRYMLAKSYAYRKDILFRECVEHIPERICYMITRKDSESSEKIQYFRHYLYDFIRQFENSVSFP